MALKKFTLTRKIALTKNVFELHYTTEDDISMLPGQFITFILPKIWGRAYSILESDANCIKLIIKKWELKEWGRGGSIYLCDAEIWDVFQGVWPSGHFILQNNSKNKVFLGTGTGLVPLYNQIVNWLEKNSWEKYRLIFWVRLHSDMFYIETFETLKNRYPERFSYQLVVSREEAIGDIQKWYVTDFLDSTIIQEYQEYYICGAPAMIQWCQDALTDLEVPEEDIYFEMYA